MYDVYFDRLGAAPGSPQALTAPGPGYDTSTELLYSDSDPVQFTSVSHGALASYLNSFVRWDAIYFTQLAKRGYLWEQEWAFGWGFANLITVTNTVFGFKDHQLLFDTEALAAIILAHVFHLLSVLMLHELTLTLCVDRSETRVASFGILAAGFHIVSPAGMFLSSPYAESPFSFLNFAGYHFYANALMKHGEGGQTQRDFLILLSGITFGIATTFRGNGLLSGLLLVWDALACGIRILRSIQISSNVRHLLVVSISGLLMACIAVVPQYLAYREYCAHENADSLRPWCSHWPPSIFTWVQRQYWGVGFLNYWTVSNLPLFVLATPMLLMLSCSGIWALRHCSNFETSVKKGNQENIEVSTPLRLNQAIARRLATPQVALAALALTSYHVQIITRLSSGYPVWYWWLASLTLEEGKISFLGRKGSTAFVISRWMIIYALIQGGLFASFLPPA